jgi:hypothetical protein
MSSFIYSDDFGKADFALRRRKIEDIVIGYWSISNKFY